MIELSNELLTALLHRHVIFEDLPTDAAIVEAQYDLRYRTWLLLVESAAFPEVPEGQAAMTVNSAKDVEYKTFRIKTTT